MLIRVTMVSPSQYALKFPATKPERMLSDAPPSREEVTTSRTCREFTEVNTFTNSGMIAPARVPQVLTAARFHHRGPSPRPPTRRGAPGAADRQVGGSEGQPDRARRGEPPQAGERGLEVHLVGVGEPGPGDGPVEQVGHAARDDHQHPHDEDPDQQL